MRRVLGHLLHELQVGGRDQRNPGDEVTGRDLTMEIQQRKSSNGYAEPCITCGGRCTGLPCGGFQGACCMYCR